MFTMFYHNQIYYVLKFLVNIYDYIYSVRVKYYI